MIYRFGHYILDTARFELRKGERAVEIEPLGLKLLIFLIENRDRVVSRDEIHSRLWGRRMVTDNSLNVSIRAVRQAIEDSGRAQSVIRTVRGAGYQFVADVDCASHRFGGLRESPDRASVDDRPAPALTPLTGDVLEHQPTLIVLPLENVGGSKSASDFARALVHDITTRIGRSHVARVIARGTAFNLRNGDRDVGEIGRKLGVRYVVQGAVQISGKRLKVSVALANAQTRIELWSEEYQRKLDDFMEIQQEIAGMVVGSLESEVQREEMQRSLLMPSTNLDAWSAFHRGLHYMYRFRSSECAKAEHCFRRSIDLEPNTPRPYAGLSFIHFERVFLGFEGKRSAEIQRARDYALESLSIDPLDPMGHWALARAQLIDSDLDASRKSLESAVELNPSYAIAQYSLGWVGLAQGDHELCHDRIGIALRLSPHDPLKFAMLGVSALNLAMMGRTKEATALSAQSILQPNAHHGCFAYAAVTYTLDGQLDRARQLFRRVRATVPGYSAGHLLAASPFRREEDVRRIRKAFDELQAADRLQ